VWIGWGISGMMWCAGGWKMPREVWTVLDWWKMTGKLIGFMAVWNGRGDGLRIRDRIVLELLREFLKTVFDFWGSYGKKYS
jgi:hypothetical protein